MAIDPYQPCPCGSGKKIKFCCMQISDEIEKIQRMLEGEQRVGCLEYIENLEKKHPDQAFLLTVRSMLEIDLERFDAAGKTVERLYEKFPDNPISLAELAMYRVVSGDVTGCVEPLHRALVLCQSQSQMPGRVYEVLSVVAQILISSGHLLAGRAHLILQAAMGGNDDPRPMQILQRLDASPEIPLLLKSDWPLSSAPEGVSWKDEFDEAFQTAVRGAWLVAREQFADLISKAPEEPAIWRNLGLLCAWLADEAGAVKTLRTFSGLSDSLDEAVEAEALSQLIDAEATHDTVDLLTLTYLTGDEEALWEKLASAPQAVPLRVDLSSLAEEGEPPPRAGFAILDRPMPDTGVGIARDDAPWVLGELLLFGRQTDREARVELSLRRNDRFDAAQQTLADLCGESIAKPPEEEVISQLSLVQEILSWNWRLPVDTPRDHRQQMMSDEHRDAILKRWPTLKLGFLGGLSPAEAAKEPANHVRLLAAILSLECSDTRISERLDYNELRSQLGLPTADPIDPEGIDILRLPTVRLRRLIVEKLADEPLIMAYRRAATTRLDDTLARLAGELVGRDHLRDQVDMAQTHGMLAELATDTDVALAHVDQAREIAEQSGRSSAQWALLELTLRIRRGEGDQVNRLIAHIQRNHAREPGVEQALFELLVRCGLINPDGTPRGVPTAAATPQPAGVAGPAEPAAETSKLWTPESESSGGGEKKAVWTPD